MDLTSSFNKHKEKLKNHFKHGADSLRKIHIPQIPYHRKQTLNEISSYFSTQFNNYFEMGVDLIKINSSQSLPSVGIDITPNCIYLCEIDAQGGKRVLTSMSSVCMEGKFLNEDIRDNKQEYISSLKNLIKENNIKNKNVALCLPVASSTVRTARVPYMNRNEIEKAIKYSSIWDSFMQPDKRPDDYSVFYQVIKTNKKHQTMEILFVAIKLSDVDLYTDIVKQSGLNPVICDVRCFAVNNSLPASKNNNANMFLEFNLEESYAMISQNGQARIYDISLSYADRIPLIESMADGKKINLFSKKICTQLKNIIRAYKITNPEINIEEIFVISQMPATSRVISNMQKRLTEYKISECRLFNCIDIEDEFTIDVKSSKLNLSTWCAAISSALEFAKKIHTNDNIKKRKIANFVSSTAAAVLAFLTFTLHGEFSNIQTDYSKQLSSLQKIEPIFEEINQEYASLNKSLNDIEQVKEIALDIKNSKERLSMVHDYLNLVILDGIWLKELQFTAPDKIEIYGGSSDDEGIVEFIQLLNEGNQFANVSLKSMQEVREMNWGMDGTQKVKNFSIRGNISNTPLFDDLGDNMVAGEVNQGG